MEKLTDELIADWIASNQRFEMRGDGGGLDVYKRQVFLLTTIRRLGRRRGQAGIH